MGAPRRADVSAGLGHGRGVKRVAGHLTDRTRGRQIGDRKREDHHAWDNPPPGNLLAFEWPLVGQGAARYAQNDDTMDTQHARDRETTPWLFLMGDPLFGSPRPESAPAPTAETLQKFVRTTFLPHFGPILRATSPNNFDHAVAKAVRSKGTTQILAQFADHASGLVAELRAGVLAFFAPKYETELNERLLPAMTELGGLVKEIGYKRFYEFEGEQNWRQPLRVIHAKRSFRRLLILAGTVAAASVGRMPVADDARAMVVRMFLEDAWRALGYAAAVAEKDVSRDVLPPEYAMNLEEVEQEHKGIRAKIRGSLDDAIARHG